MCLARHSELGGGNLAVLFRVSSIIKKKKKDNDHLSNHRGKESKYTKLLLENKQNQPNVGTKRSMYGHMISRKRLSSHFPFEMEEETFVSQQIILTRIAGGSDLF